MSDNKYDVIIVGAGYPGCSAAYHLSAAGFKVLLVEKKEIAGGASGANFGCVQVQDANLGQSLELTLRSYHRVMQFEHELSRELELEEIGSLIVAADDEEMQELETLYKGKKEAGLDISWLKPEQIKNIEPNIEHRNFLGATYYRQGRLNPFKLMFGFVQKGKENGLEVSEYTEVKRLYLEGGIVKGVVLEDGKILYSENVLVAAGSWTRELCRSAGVDVPVEYVKAEAFITEKLEPVLFNYYSAASFFTEAHNQEEAGMSLCMAQTASGNLLIGETSKPGRTHPDSMSNQTSWEHCVRVRKKLQSSFPVLKEAGILRSWVTPSPFTESMEPVLGPVGPSGLLVAAGFKSCVIMTAVTGEIVTDLIAKGKTFCDLSVYTGQVKWL